MLYFFAGPNGSGKSTLFPMLQEKGTPVPFINADVIGKMLAGAPSTDVLAQKVADLMREHFMESAVTFATETVFSDPVRAKLDYLRRAAANGYRVVLLATWIPSANASILRVRNRVQNGGHAVPEEKLRRRFAATMKNLREAFGFVETVLVFDNSGPMEDGPQLVATLSKGQVTWKDDDIPRGISDLLPGAAS